MLEMQLNHLITVSAPVMQALHPGRLGYVRFCGADTVQIHLHIFFFFTKDEIIYALGIEERVGVHTDTVFSNWL